MEVEVWSELLAQIKDLRRLQSKYASRILIENDLPEEFLMALLRFRHYLDQGPKGPIGMLKHTAMSSPPLRQYYARMPPKDPMSTVIGITGKPNLKLDKPHAEFKWLLEVLLEDDHRLFLLGLTTAVDELDRLLQNESAAKEMVLSYMATVLGDLAAFTEGRRQVDLHQPWAQTFEDLMVDKKERIQKEFTERTAIWEALLGAINGPREAALGTLEDGRFFYLVEKPRNKKDVEAMRTAEANLDEFWAAVDNKLRKKIGSKLEDTGLRKLLSQPRTLHRTPQWIEPGNDQSGQKSQREIESLLKPLCELYLILDRKRGGTTGHQVLKENVPLSSKAKTRGAPSSAAPLQRTDAAPSALSDTQPAFTIDARALKVFRTLFYTASVSATPGEVAWTDFLHAMHSTGFLPEKLYGSVWQFKPTKLDVERSIQFHEPHPSGKLPYKTTRRFGRRLERAYGWVGSMFVLREKRGEQ